MTTLARVCLFFFKGHGDHRYRHSSPTRRSPDLDCTSLCRPGKTPAWTTTWTRCSPPLDCGCGRCGNNATRRWPTCPRSEEHTSELQSRQYLVCRLLLEKKKHSKLLRPHRRHSYI